MKSRKRKLAWLLSVTMAITSVNPGMMVTASDENEITGQAVEEVSDPATEENDLTRNTGVETFPEMNEEASDAAAGYGEEILLDEDEITDILLEETETDLEEEIQIGEFENESIDPVLTEMDEVSVLSAYFEDLREGDYATYFFDDENGELRLNTEDLSDEDFTISWEAGYRKEEQNEEDSFESEGIPENMIFWSETSDKNTIGISGAKLNDAYKWLEDTHGEEYWFEVRAHVIINDKEVCMAQAGIHTRETKEKYYFPLDRVMLQGWGDHVNRWYDGWLENKEYLSGTEIQAEVIAVSVNNAEDETDSTSVCRIVNENNNGWDISAERTGTAIVTITYKDRNGQEQIYSYALHVSTEKYTLEPQWGPSEGNMLTNSTMEINFVLRHQRIAEDVELDETVTNWNLDFAPDENVWIYDTNLLKNVEINNEEKKISIESGAEIWGTDILLKATLSSE